jgi:hypothetical protein
MKTTTYLRKLRWLVLGTGLVTCLWACISHPLAQPVPKPEQQSNGEVTIVPMRHLDLLFMVDNSQSMKPKQDKMKKQFPRLIEGLRDRNDGTLPDLRVAILDSDVGSGRSDACGAGSQGDMGKFQMRDPVGCGANENARWLELTNGKPVNFTGEIDQVFGCLASNVGVDGCGYEHQLGVFQWAFYADVNSSQWDFIRPEAYLGIVILTDEDDCTASPGTNMFNKRVLAEGGSLRCATRGHQCDGAQLSFPTTGPVSVPYASCHARTDATCDEDKVDTTEATSCTPLTSIADTVEAVRQLKGGGDAADEKILVAAIYGTQRAGDTSTPMYKIDLAKDPSKYADPGSKIWDYWPICYDPDYLPENVGQDVATEHGATGGLRIDAFLNGFPARNRRAYSICESDFGPAMQGIGEALSNLMGDLCVPFKLADSSDDPGLQADCRVAYRVPHEEKDKDGHWTTWWEEKSEGLPSCESNNHQPDCWEVVLGKENGTDAEKAAAKRCPAKGNTPSQMVNVVRKKDSDLPVGTKAVMQCLTCVDPTPGIEPIEGCDY